MVLYAIIIVSFGYAGFLFFKGRISFIVFLPFIMNIIFNLAFTPLQSGLRNNLLASTDILLIFGTLIWLFVAIYPHAKWVALVNIPYLLWVSFATLLQLTITYLNR
jgi:tryptophan-rich sensory protein